MTDKQVPATIKQKEGYVEIEFDDSMPKEAIEAQVSECQAATCKCCTPEFREKVTDFDASDLKNNKVKVYGTISKDEVEKNVFSCAPNLNDK